MSRFYSYLPSKLCRHQFKNQRVCSSFGFKQILKQSTRGNIMMLILTSVQFPSRPSLARFQSPSLIIGFFNQSLTKFNSINHPLLQSITPFSLAHCVAQTCTTIALVYLLLTSGTKHLMSLDHPCESVCWISPRRSTISIIIFCWENFRKRKFILASLIGSLDRYLSFQQVAVDQSWSIILWLETH